MCAAVLFEIVLALSLVVIGGAHCFSPALTPNRPQVRKALPALQFLDGKDIRPKKGAEGAPTEAALRDAAVVAAAAGAPVAAAEEKSTVEFALPAEREDLVHLRLELLSLTVGCDDNSGPGFFVGFFCAVRLRHLLTYLSACCSEFTVTGRVPRIAL